MNDRTPPKQQKQLEKLVKQMAELCVGPELRAWIDANTTFPNTMVDRITPATEDVHRQVLKQVSQAGRQSPRLS